jgi:hypothetical protein
LQIPWALVAEWVRSGRTRIAASRLPGQLAGLLAKPADPDWLTAGEPGAEHGEDPAPPPSTA